MRRFTNVLMTGSGLFLISLLSVWTVSQTANADEGNKVVQANAVAARPIAAVEEEGEKLTIKKVMILAHKEGLLKKVATGSANEEETAQLHKYYLALPELKPPRGEDESWQEKTAALVAAAKAAVDKDKDASIKLKSASNCKACHEVHK